MNKNKTIKYEGVIFTFILGFCLAFILWWTIILNMLDPILFPSGYLDYAYSNKINVEQK